jgi:tetratricopeptide repeat protein
LRQHRAQQYELSRPRRARGMLVLAVLAVTAFGQTGDNFQRAGPSTTESDAVQATTKNDGYVGSQTCGDCHSEIYRQYMRTGMGRSMSSVSSVAPALLQKLHVPALYSNQRLDRRYDLIARDGKLYESEYALDGSGRTIFREEHQLEWIVGSGANGIGAIVRRGDHLFEAPLTLYTSTKTWEMSPGYESTDVGFSRPILTACLSCHSGRSNPIPGSDGRYENNVFSEIPIGCENCHGPGAAHINAATSGALGKGRSFAIVNPARLTPNLANNICMRCHEIGDERILKPGKEYKDIRPGEPLDNTLSIFMTPPTREAPPDKDHLQHYYAMTLSKCYRASGGRLSCITCHDPHVEPAEEEAPAFFNKRCIRCHADQSCKLATEARQDSSPPDNCIGCHMPKRDIGFIAHSSLTNHRIIAQANEPFPESTFSQSTAALPDLVHLNPAPGEQDAAPPLLTLLQTYGDLAGHIPEYGPSYYRVLDQLQQTEPNVALVQAALGRRCLQVGDLQEAIEHLKQSLAIGSTQSMVYSDLSEALDKTGQRERGLAMLQKAIQVDPFNPLLQRSLVFRLIDLKQYANARAAMSRYSEIFPQDFFMRQKFAVAMESAPAH